MVGWEGVTLMRFTRICLVAAAVVIGLHGCTRGTDNPPPAEVSSPDSAPVPPPSTPAKTVAPTANPPVTQPSPPRATAKINAPVANTPLPISTTTKSATPPDAPIPLDLIALEKQLKSTKAIGVFSKIALKNQVDDLMKLFRDHYKGKSS